MNDDLMVSAQSESRNGLRLGRPAPPATAVLVDTVQVVCTGFLGLRPEPAATLAPGPGDVVIATVRYAGAWRAVLSIECGVFEAMQLAYGLLGPVEDLMAHAADLIGELTNMVAERLKSTLPRGAETAGARAGVFPSSFSRCEIPAADISQSFAFAGGVLVVSVRMLD